MNSYASLESVKIVVDQLSIADKIRLIETMLPDIKNELIGEKTIKRIKIKGLWKDLDISDAEITENRQMIWQNFPREDF
jgi:hypothetical protein